MKTLRLRARIFDIGPGRRCATFSKASASPGVDHGARAAAEYFSLNHPHRQTIRKVIWITTIRKSMLYVETVRSWSTTASPRYSGNGKGATLSLADHPEGLGDGRHQYVLFPNR
jgi:hypothetical protein